MQENKFDKNKPRLALVPPDSIIAIGTIMTYGIGKYKEDVWKTIEPQRYRDAFVRHWVEYIREPQGVDNESGFPHLWHCITNLAFLCEIEGVRF